MNTDEHRFFVVTLLRFRRVDGAVRSYLPPSQVSYIYQDLHVMGCAHVLYNRAALDKALLQNEIHVDLVMLFALVNTF